MEGGTDDVAVCDGRERAVVLVSEGRVGVGGGEDEEGVCDGGEGAAVLTE